MHVGGSISDIVRHVQLPIISAKLCNKFYEELGALIDFFISDDMLCAGYDDGGRDACQVSDSSITSSITSSFTTHSITSSITTHTFNLELYLSTTNQPDKLRKILKA